MLHQHLAIALPRHLERLALLRLPFVPVLEGDLRLLLLRPFHAARRRLLLAAPRLDRRHEPVESLPVGSIRSTTSSARTASMMAPVVTGRPEARSVAPKPSMARVRSRATAIRSQLCAATKRAMPPVASSRLSRLTSSASLTTQPRVSATSSSSR